VRPISSKLTFYYKRIFPFVWFGILAVFLIVGGFGLLNENGPASPMFLIAPVIMAVVGYFFMQKLLFDLVDEVLDGGDALVVRNGGQEARIALSDIMNVSYSVYTNPPRVTLALRKPSIFGDRISFCAPARFVPFATSPIIDELTARIDAKRQFGEPVKR
jgi:hypothetical protein